MLRQQYTPRQLYSAYGHLDGNPIAMLRNVQEIRIDMLRFTNFFSVSVSVCLSLSRTQSPRAAGEN